MSQEQEIPDGVEEWLFIGVDESIETRSVSSVEGRSIATGRVGNELTDTVQQFVETHSMYDYLIVAEHPSFRDSDRDVLWGSLAIAFENRKQAEMFADLVTDCDANLRLSSGKEGDWFLFESE